MNVDSLCKHGHELIGNAEHLPNMVLVVAAALSSIRIRRQCPPLLGHEIYVHPDIQQVFANKAKNWKDQKIEFQCRLLGRRVKETELCPSEDVDPDKQVYVVEVLWCGKQACSEHHGEDAWQIYTIDHPSEL